MLAYMLWNKKAEGLVVFEAFCFGAENNSVSMNFS
jgi:hypothetical protein